MNIYRKQTLNSRVQVLREVLLLSQTENRNNTARFIHPITTKELTLNFKYSQSISRGGKCEKRFLEQSWIANKVQFAGRYSTSSQEVKFIAKITLMSSALSRPFQPYCWGFQYRAWQKPLQHPLGVLGNMKTYTMGIQDIWSRSCALKADSIVY